MMRYLLLALGLVAGTAFAGGITKESISSAGRQRTYYLFVPQHPTGALIITLHGSGRSGSILVEHWQRLAEKEGIVLAGPQAIESEGWRYPVDGPDFLRDVVEAVKAKVAIDPRRIYLFGHSAGAIFALKISMLESEYFAAAAVHAGSLLVQDYVLFGNARRKIPIWMVVGTWDKLFPLTEVRATRDALQKNGFPVELVEIAHHTHDYYGSSREINEKAWAFLSQQSLPSEPKYLIYATDSLL